MPRILNKRKDLIPSDAIYIGRPSKWGNPFRLDSRSGMTGRFKVIGRYRRWMSGDPDIIRYVGREPPSMEDVRRELRGKDLVCWCAPLPCHGDVLLELANREAAHA